VVGVEQWAEIRRLHFVEGLSQREVRRRTGLHRDTIRRAITSSDPARPCDRCSSQARASAITAAFVAEGDCGEPLGGPVPSAAFAGERVV